MKLYPLPPAATSSLELGLPRQHHTLTYYASPALPFSSPFRRSRSESITVEATICPVFVNVVAVGLCTMKTIAVVESLLAIMRAFADFVALVRLPHFEIVQPEADVYFGRPASGGGGLASRTSPLAAHALVDLAVFRPDLLTSIFHVYSHVLASRAPPRDGDRDFLPDVTMGVIKQAKIAMTWAALLWRPIEQVAHARQKS
ncbi:hypothetical protein H9P43_006422 [Blastocladiella emersonii ATCC 22665]|nr:hypothetical protein H9P43_006422 [Blastocladiella emersonii ATCC 22665]